MSPILSKVRISVAASVRSQLSKLMEICLYHYESFKGWWENLHGIQPKLYFEISGFHDRYHSAVLLYQFYNSVARHGF